MASWTCSLCDPEDYGEHHATKYPVLEHIREEHLDTLVRSALERSASDVDQEIEVGRHDPVEALTKR